MELEVENYMTKNRIHVSGYSPRPNNLKENRTK